MGWFPGRPLQAAGQSSVRKQGRATVHEYGQSVGSGGEHSEACVRKGPLSGCTDPRPRRGPRGGGGPGPAPREEGSQRCARAWGFAQQVAGLWLGALCLPQKPPHNSDTGIDQEHVQRHSLVPRGNLEFLLKPERVRPSRNKNVLTGISVSILRFFFVLLFHFFIPCCFHFYISCSRECLTEDKTHHRQNDKPLTLGSFNHNFLDDFPPSPPLVPFGVTQYTPDFGPCTTLPPGGQAVVAASVAATISGSPHPRLIPELARADGHSY